MDKTKIACSLCASPQSAHPLPQIAEFLLLINRIKGLKTSSFHLCFLDLANKVKC